MASPTLVASTYTISQLCRIFGATPRALRFYEQIGLVEPRRVEQRRIYSRGDYQRIRVITSGRKAGLSLEQIRELLDLYEPADNGAAQLRKAVEQLRQRVGDLETERDIAAQHLSVLEQRLARQTLSVQGVGQGRPPRRVAPDEVMGHQAR
jgi:DNA-binding transcriptional MerR regulator